MTDRTSVIDSFPFFEAVLSQAMTRVPEAEDLQPFTFRMENLNFTISWTKRCPTVAIHAPMDHPKAEHIKILAFDLAATLVSEVFNNDFKAFTLKEEVDIKANQILTSCEITDYYS